MIPIFNVIPKSSINVCYAQVSSNKQGGDLERQIESLRVDHPHHEIITDVGSVFNSKRRGLLGLLNRIHNDEIDTIMITGKDRLADLVSNTWIGSAECMAQG
jgi:predicted site-specific integrase-resolvase